MASEAQVDLVISTAGALPQLESDLRDIVNQAEADADALDLQALLDTETSLANVIAEVDRLVDQATAAGEDIVLQARLEQQESLAEVLDDIQDLITDVEARTQEIQLQAELDQETAELDAELTALIEELEASAPEIEIEVEIDRDGRGERSITNLSKALTGLAGPLGKAAAGIGAAGVAAGSAVPLLAGVATAVQNIAPAAAVAVSGMIALQLATNTVKIAMIGVEEAISTAFDPEATPEELAKAMEGLAPEAKKFVTELASMKKALKEVQQTVQNNFFKGFDVALRDLGKTALPVLSNALRVSSRTLNEMALGAANAASKLAKDGVLGRALSGANVGLLNLSKVPAQVVTALGQLGAAASPAFDRITTAAANAATRISDKLSAAFESGALEDAINGAVDLIAQLGRVAGNVFKGLGNIIGTLDQSGQGLFSTLESITKAFADVTATKGFQDALKALSSVASTIVATVLPLLSQALQALGPVFQAIGPPIELLVKALGDALKPVIEALGPVLVDLGLAFGRLVGVVTPFITLAGQLIAAILPVLSPLLDAVGQALNEMIPFAKEIAAILAAELVPFFNRLATEILPQLLPPLLELGTKLFPVMLEVLTALAPSLIQLAEAFTEVLVQVTPLIVQLIELTSQMLDKLMPIIQPLIDLLIKLATGALGILVFQLMEIVVPALKVLVDLLQGDFRAAWEGAKGIVETVASKIGDLASRMKDRVVEQLRLLADQAAAKIRDLRDRMVSNFEELVNQSVGIISRLPGLVADQLGSLGGVLFRAGSNAVQGFIDGLTSRLGKLRDIASQIASTISGGVSGFLDIHSPSRVMRDIGHDTMDGMLLGVADRIPDLRDQLQGVAALAPTFGFGDGRSIKLPQFGQTMPTVQVFLGNELINQHVDTRISQSNQARDRLAIQGVRR